MMSPYYKKDKERFHKKNLLKFDEEKNLAILILNQVMFKLLTFSKYLELNYQQIQHLFALLHYVLNMPSIFTFHISHIT